MPGIYVGHGVTRTKTDGHQRLIMWWLSNVVIFSNPRKNVLRLILMLSLRKGNLFLSSPLANLSKHKASAHDRLQILHPLAKKHGLPINDHWLHIRHGLRPFEKNCQICERKHFVWQPGFRPCASLVPVGKETLVFRSMRKKSTRNCQWQIFDGFPCICASIVPKSTTFRLSSGELKHSSGSLDGFHGEWCQHQS